MYAITGATGNTGSVIADELLKQGKPVRVIGRNLDKMKRFADRGAEVIAASVESAANLTAAFEGCEAVYAMIPPQMTEHLLDYQHRAADAVIDAVKKSGVKHVVLLSSIGAELPSGTGPIVGLYDFEAKLNALDDVNALFLRPPYFMENTLGNIGMIKMLGFNGSAMKPDTAFPMVATQDIGHIAARRLLELDFRGKEVQEILGNREITWTEITQIIGKAVGIPDLKYVQFSYEDAINGMVGVGFPRDLAETFVELGRAMNDGLLKYRSARTAANTTPTTYEEFVKTRFAPAFLKS